MEQGTGGWAFALVTRTPMRENTSPMPTVTVRLFARLSDIAGARETEIEIGEGLTAADAFAALARAYPEMEALTDTVRFAVNAEYVPSSHRLEPGDELALIPPVSGGAGAV